MNHDILLISDFARAVSEKRVAREIMRHAPRALFHYESASYALFEKSPISVLSLTKFAIMMPKVLIITTFLLLFFQVPQTQRMMRGSSTRHRQLKVTPGAATPLASHA